MTWPFRKTPEEVAARLWVKRHSGSWSERDERAFLEWLEAAPDHRVIYERVVAACELAGRIPIAAHEKHVGSRLPLFLHWRTVGVALLIGVVAIPTCKRLGDWWNGIPSTLSAQSNSPRTFNLSDGTRIDLDAGTEVIVQWGSRARHARVVRGEALFSVSHDSTRPLVVNAGRGRLTDLGTVFDVATWSNSVRVSVLEGRVGLKTAHGEVVLTAGHGGGYESTGELMPVTRVDDSVTSWREGVRRFDSVALAEVLDILARRHAVELSITDPAAAKLRLSGTLRVDDLPLSLRTLGMALQLRVRWIDAHHIELSTKASDHSDSGDSVED